MMLKTLRGHHLAQRLEEDSRFMSRLHPLHQDRTLDIAGGSG